MVIKSDRRWSALTTRTSQEYGRAIQGALHFPLISPPASAWLARALLYWDEVGTIVPYDWVKDPELLGEHTLELVRRELLLQVFPHWVEPSYGKRFQRWLEGLEPSELARRRKKFSAGERFQVHRDKWLAMGGGALDVASNFGLVAERQRRSQKWIEVEATTADEFMASLALGLCHPDSDLSSGEDRGLRWVPATGESSAVSGLLAGLVPDTDANGTDRDLRLRVQGELRACELRTILLEKALPVPADPPTPEELERFRRRHGARLPSMRRHLEALIDGMSDEEVRRFREVDRFTEEMEELVGEAERYLNEAGLRQISRTPLLRVLKFAPGLSAPVDATIETAASLETASDFAREPLAYLAFARVELRLGDRYRIPADSEPLVALFDG
jgi:hypothetical protein